MTTDQRITITITILGGPEDGWNGRISVPRTENDKGHIRIKGVVYRKHESGGRTSLVHPMAQRLIWKD